MKPQRKLDAESSQQLREGVTLRFAGQNLRRDHGGEFVQAANTVRIAHVERSAYVKLTWEF
jgi:hypothetical protein